MNIKRLLIWILSILAIYLWILVGLTGCKTSQVVLNNSDSTLVRITERIVTDTTFIPADTSAWVRALIECDSNNHAVVTDLVNRIGQRSRIKTDTVTVKKKVYLTANCVCDSLAIYNEYKVKDTSAVTKIIQQVAVEVPAKLTWWERFKIEYGGWAMGLILAYLIIQVGWFVLKKYLNVQFPITNFLK